MSVHRACGYCWAGFEIADHVMQLYKAGNLDKDMKDQVKYCTRCRKMKLEFGSPNLCRFCGMISRFGEEEMCQRCCKIIEKFGKMNECSSCKVDAGYKNLGDDRGNVSFCYRCRKKYASAKNARKDRMKENQDLKRIKLDSSLRLTKLMDLSNDMLERILIFMDGADLLCSLSFVSKLFRKLLSSMNIWVHIKSMDFSAYASNLDDYSFVRYIRACPLFDFSDSEKGICMLKDPLSRLDLHGCKKVGVSLSAYLHLFKGINYLNLNECIILPEVITSIYELCPYLIDLRISNLNRNPIPIEMYRNIMNESPKLQILDVEGWGLTSDANVSCARFAVSSLKALIISSNRITDWGISIARFKFLNSSLRYLDLSSCTEITDDGARHISETCINLIYLNLRKSSVLNQGIYEILSSCLLLQVLDISSTNVNDSIFQMDLRHDNLKELYANGCSHLCKGKNIAFLGLCFPGLSGLDISECMNSSDEIISIMCGHLKTLTWINLGSLIPLTKQSIFELAVSNPNLCEIYIGGCFYIQEETLTLFLRRYQNLRLIRHNNHLDCERKKRIEMI
jgi:hypothetical protein